MKLVSKLLGGVLVIATMSTQAFGALCQVDLARPNGEVLHDFYAERVSLDDACPAAIRICDDAKISLLNVRRPDIRLFDAVCTVATDWERPNPFPSIVIRPVVDTVDTNCGNSSIFEDGDTTDHCYMTRIVPLTSVDNATIQSVQLISSNGKCAGNWNHDAFAVHTENNCEGRFRITYRYLSVD